MIPLISKEFIWWRSVQKPDDKLSYAFDPREEVAAVIYLAAIGDTKTLRHVVGQGDFKKRIIAGNKCLIKNTSIYFSQATGD